jgi:4-amino-4-deoxy-L-arabinose transferase-like glycosyltransferase
MILASNANAERSGNVERNVLLAILGVAVLLRVAAATMLPDQSALLVDAGSYRDLARGLIEHGVIAGGFYQMPLYPVMIALTGFGWGQLAADIALSVASVWLVYAIAVEIFGDRLAALLAATAAACYPPLIFFAVVGLSETLFITMLLAAFLCWYRNQFTLGAVFAVLAILTRPIFDVMSPVLIVVFALAVHRLSLVQTAARLVVYAIVYCVMLLPWWFNNYRVFDSFVRLTPNLGTVLYAGNNPLNTSGGGNMGVDYDLLSFAAIADPLARDRALRNAAVDYILAHPVHFVKMAGLKFIRMWRLWPANEGYANAKVIAVSVLSFVPVLLLAGIGLLAARADWLRLSPILLFALGLTAISMVLVGTIRYRLPVEPFLLILAGLGGSHLLAAIPATRALPAVQRLRS